MLMLFNCIFAYKHLLFETFEMVLDQINDLLDFANPKALTYDVGPAGLDSWAGELEAGSRRRVILGTTS